MSVIIKTFEPSFQVRVKEPILQGLGEHGSSVITQMFSIDQFSHILDTFGLNSSNEVLEYSGEFLNRPCAKGELES